MMYQEILFRANRINDGIKTLTRHICERKNRWNAGIRTIINRSVSNSVRGPVCDLKTVTEVSEYGRFYPKTSIRSTKSHNPSPRPISGNKCAMSDGQCCQRMGSALSVNSRLRISRQTVYRGLNHVVLYARRPAVCIPLTSAQKCARLNW